MNKTVNINIGGLVFHIDEDAYQKLTRYFEAIKRSLSNSSGKDEIMKDIEMRVAELLTEKQKSDKHVINNKDVDEVIGVMGQPEDYRLDDDADDKPAEPFYPYTKSKKLYRDKDRATIAGVCTGLSHYFGIESVWIKIFFILLIWAGGAGIIAYLVLWIATPKAITTTEKLEMTGEPVTISNIEKKVREEFDIVANRVKNVDYDKMGNEIRTGASRTADGIGEVFVNIFKVFAKILGAIIVVFSSVALLGICFASIFMIFSSSMPDNYILNHISTPIGLETPIWVQGVLFLLAAGIPAFFFLILGLKLLVTNLKSLGNIVKFTLLGIWIIAMGLLISLGINEATLIAYDGKDVKKEVINIAPTDTLLIKFKNNEFYSKDRYHNTDFRLTQDEKNKEVIYSNNISFEVRPTEEALPYIQIERMAAGKSAADAKGRAEKIEYGYKVEGNQLILDNYLLTDVINKFRGQKVELYLYLPKGTLFKADESVQNFDNGYNDFFDLQYNSDEYIYKVEESHVKCLTCPDDENENGDAEGTTEVITNENDSTDVVTVKVNGKIVTETKTGKGATGNDKKTTLSVDKNGVIIKTK
ncbi:PspC domain-containing protein [Flavobacterium wongokense]|uniref:PspC domain-containing protein n=1 Tax=Flavobacterium wongokense TaxID=2910674 RepID=UPI001F16EE7E|nr:PspC domain-containing protein [Flavobacterium sp. WG47]MCF6132307.1 PspC domain-containing protein [Flavobacterium sp. WG47]